MNSYKSIIIEKNRNKDLKKYKVYLSKIIKK